jgi:hypothetical protein
LIVTSGNGLANVGGAFSTSIVVVAVSVSWSSSRTRRATLRVRGPSSVAAEKVGEAPVASMSKVTPS